MKNPWLSIPAADYVNHMSEVGQSQVLNQLTKKALEKYQPKRFALLGCATGNGLEHVDNDITEEVYAIDINPEYLRQAEAKFKGNIAGLQTMELDIETEPLPLKNINLCFAGLLLEYIASEPAIQKITATLHIHGVLVIVIQQNANTSFVTKTRYESLMQLSDISKEVHEANLHSLLIAKNMKRIARSEISLTANKKFIVMEYKKESKYGAIS